MLILWMCGDITTINAGNADSTGFELQTSYQIMENLGVFGAPVKYQF